MRQKGRQQPEPIDSSDRQPGEPDGESLVGTDEGLTDEPADTESQGGFEQKPYSRGKDGQVSFGLHDHLFIRAAGGVPVYRR